MLGRNRKFYHALTKKYTAIFGSLFNDIWFDRSDGVTPDAQTTKVPLGYGPREKWLAKKTEDNDGNRDVAITLPRMSYELVSLVYDSTRAINPQGAIRAKTASVDGTYANVYNPVPYNLYFQLSIMAKTIDDGMKIVEQIVPNFTPGITVSFHPIDDLPDYVRDVPIILNNVSNDDTYEGDFINRRTIIWVLDFTVKAYFYRDVRNTGVIKIAFTNIYPGFANNVLHSKTTIYPGMDANGHPTTDANAAIDPHLVNFEDDWDYVIIREDVINDE